jgi:hypothetical protein
MRRNRANYHNGVRQVKEDEDSIVRDRIANALIDDPNQNFLAEVKKMRSNKACTSRIVDGCTDAIHCSVVPLKYCTLYSNVPLDAAEMHNLLTEVNTKVIADCGFIGSPYSHWRHTVSQLTISYMLVLMWYVLLLFWLFV